jgi:hypothetical protein
MRHCSVVSLASLLLSLLLFIACAKATKNESALTAEQIDIHVLFFHKFRSENKVNSVLIDEADQLKLSECQSGSGFQNLT